MSEPIHFFANAGQGRATVVPVTPATPLPVGMSPTADSTTASSYYEYTAGSITKKNIKASAGKMLKFHVTNKNAAVRWLLLHNKATDPVATDVGTVTFEIPAGTATVPGFVEFEFKFGPAFSAGIGWSVGTTAASFTDAATASEHVVHVEYI